MKIAWSVAIPLLLVIVIVLFVIKVFIWEIIGIAAVVALAIYLYKRFVTNKQ